MENTKQKPRAGAKPQKASARAKPAPKAKAKPVAKAVKSAAKPAARNTRAVVAKKAPAKKPVAAVKKSVAAKPVAAPAKAPVKSVKSPAKAVAKPAAKAPVGKPSAPVAVVAPAMPAKAAVPPPKSSKSPVTETKTSKPAASGSTAALKARAVPAAQADNGVTMQDGRYALPATTRIDLPNAYRPSAKEEYMNPKHLEFFRRKLQGWREDLVEESKQTIENLRDEVRDVGDEAERATRETENSLELRTRDRYRKLIAKIDKALKRIEEGRYGFCEETDEEIGLDRLDARPIATLCLDAQERWEHRQKQMGD
jgi:DnaK suppressor protein